MQVFITRKIPAVGIDLLKEKIETIDIWESSNPPSYEQLLERAQGADALLCMLSDRIDAHLIKSCSRLKVISNYAVGTNNIDLQCAKERGILVGNTPGVLTEATADLTLALLLSLTRKLIPGYNNGRNGLWRQWEPLGFLGLDLQGKTLGIFGMGRIGQAFAKKCRLAFQMKILYTSRTPKSEIETSLKAERVSWSELLETSDVLSFHADLNDSTRGVLNSEALAKMKKDAVILNTSRGELINTADLLAALKSNALWGAGLDVTDPEPLPMDHPLWSQPNVLITPHIGSATVETRNQMALMAARNVLRGLGLD